MAEPQRDERPRLLDPLDRISEVLFGLVMAVTIVGSLSIATAGETAVRTVMIAALGCNIAWGLVDAVMYVVRGAAERARLWALGRRLRESDADAARRLIMRELPEHLAAALGPAEVDAMRKHLIALPVPEGSLLRGRDLLEALGIFALVALATFPVVLPFMLVADMATAMLYARVTTVVMLFIAGVGFGRYAGYPRPWLTGLAMAVFGVLLIVAVKALGG